MVHRRRCPEVDRHPRGPCRPPRHAPGPRPLRRLAVVWLLAALALAACDFLPYGQPSVACGDFEGPDCNDLIELGHDALGAGRMDAPSAIAVTGACPPNARCAASELGGPTAAVAVRWPDGQIAWGTMALPADWPDSPAGPVTIESGPPPDHLLTLVEP